MVYGRNVEYFYLYGLPVDVFQRMVAFLGPSPDDAIWSHCHVSIEHCTLTKLFVVSLAPLRDVPVGFRVYIIK